MTYKESEYPEILEHLLDLIQRADKVTLRKIAASLKKIHSRFPIYPGLALQEFLQAASQTHSAQQSPKGARPSGNSIHPDASHEVIPLQAQWPERGPSGKTKVPQSWRILSRSLLKIKPSRERAFTVLVYGGMDTGKTSLVTSLAHACVRAGRSVAVLDCDMGQSDIGPPGTIGLAWMKEPVRTLSELVPDSLYFVGSYSAAVHFLPTLVGTQKLFSEASQRTDFVLLDTTGWVSGDSARAFRQAELELIQPDLIVLLERGKELEHLVKNIPEQKIARLRVPACVVSTSSEERKKMRENMSRRYFLSAQAVEFRWEKDKERSLKTDRAYLLSGEAIHPASVKTLWAERLSGKEGILVVSEKVLNQTEIRSLQREFSIKQVKVILSGAERGLLTALCDEHFRVLALALIQKIDYASKKISLLSPIQRKHLSQVKIIQFGSVCLNPDGAEAGFVEPGYF